MSGRYRYSVVHPAGALLALSAVVGCRQRTAPRPSPAPSVTVTALPSLPAVQVASAPSRAAPRGTSARAGAPEKRITLSATNADVRSLLLAIASQGNVNLVLSPDVVGRVSVVLNDVPVSEALRRVLTEAGLGVNAREGITLPWDPTIVFYQLPVNVDLLTVEGIMARYGVGRGIAETILDSRPLRRP